MKIRMVFICFILSIYTLPTIAQMNNSFVLITPLYNETNMPRCVEYLYCLDKNMANENIDEIHILYDIDRDNNKNILLRYLKTKKIKITYIKGRPTYQDCFDLAHSLYPNRKIIIANGDIFFNATLALLNDFDFTNKFLAITRWDLARDGSLNIFKVKGKVLASSHDAWIYQDPIKNFSKADFQLGVVSCDSLIAGQAWLSGLQVINPCLSIQAVHMHQTKLRNRGACVIENMPIVYPPECRIDQKEYPAPVTYCLYGKSLMVEIVRAMADSKGLLLM